MSRVILKFSGEALKNAEKVVAEEKLQIILEVIEYLNKNNHEVAVVIGGGNFFRGREHNDMDNVTKDTIGMLGTVMNGLYLKDYLRKNQINAYLTTPFDFNELLDKYEEDELINLYNKKDVIIFGGGIGKSGYSTDSATVMAAKILEADLIIKMTNVDGVYTDDPKVNPNALYLPKLSYEEVIKNNYGVMDLYAIEECQKRNIKILVMNIADYHELDNYFQGKSLGTIIGG